MAVIPYPATLYGPGGQTKRIMSKEAEAALGTGWSRSQKTANPTSEYPKYMYKGKAKKLVSNVGELMALGDGWVDSINDAKSKK